MAKRIEDLQDELKQRDRRIEELRTEVDELRHLVQRMEENVSDSRATITSWCETFGMECVSDDGIESKWTWEPFWKEHAESITSHNELVRRWNQWVHQMHPRNVGRPLAASEAQQAQVIKLRNAGRSLRWIAEETSLGLNTVV